MEIILASGSPRRRELLNTLGLRFTVCPAKGEETAPEGAGPAEIVKALSRAKAGEVARQFAGELIIAADTIVYLDGRVLGKPHDEEDARQMLRTLSGRTHEVITGVTLLTTQFRRSFACTTRVTFASLTEEEIEFYVSHYRPMDKAGSYGVQEWIGYIGVTSIEGSFYNVMGLPIQRLYTELKNIK